MHDCDKICLGIIQSKYLELIADDNEYSLYSWAVTICTDTS